VNPSGRMEINKSIGDLRHDVPNLLCFNRMIVREKGHGFIGFECRGSASWWEKGERGRKKKRGVTRKRDGFRLRNLSIYTYIAPAHRSFMTHPIVMESGKRLQDIEGFIAINRLTRGYFT
jgi:hypothetical protein